MEEESNENREISPIVDPPPNEKPKLGFIYRHYKTFISSKIFIFMDRVLLSWFFETSYILDG